MNYELKNINTYNQREDLDQEYTWPSARVEVSSSQQGHFQNLPRCGRELRRAPRDRINEMLMSSQTKKNLVFLSSTNLFCWRWRPCPVHLVKWGENKSKGQAQKCTKYAVENHLWMTISDLSAELSIIRFLDQANGLGNPASYKKWHSES